MTVEPTMDSQDLPTGARASRLPPLLAAMRPAQWVKNLFVLAPLVFAERLMESDAILRGAVAFLAFCAASSAVYLINDLRDRESDRAHPVKRFRPLAAGNLSVTAATIAIGVLSLGSLAVGAWLGWSTAGIIALYLAMNLAYSWGLKHFVILDVMIIAIGFVLRVMGGGQAVEVEVSSWLLLCTIFLALFLGLSKRRHELLLIGAGKTQGRRVLSDYSEPLLDQMINVVTASSVLAYVLYIVSDETVERFGNDQLVYTVPMVLFGIFRYLYLMYRRPDLQSPTEAMLKDAPFLLNLALWGLAVVWILYS